MVLMLTMKMKLCCFAFRSLLHTFRTTGIYSDLIENLISEQHTFALDFSNLNSEIMMTKCS